MKTARIRNTSRRTESKTDQWAGLNKNALIADNQFAAMTNASTKNFPILSPRPSRTAVVTLDGVGWALYAAPTVVCWVDGTSFKYNGTTEGTVTASLKSMAELNGKIAIFPDKKTYDYVDDEFAVMIGQLQIQKAGYDTNGVYDFSVDETKICNKNIVQILPSTSYTLVNDKSYTVASVYYFDANVEFISTAAVNFSAFTTPATAYYMNLDITGTDVSAEVSITNGVYPTESAIPALDYIAELNNRMWGVKGDRIYSTALGDINDWTRYSVPTTLTTDSWTVDTGSAGDFTGLARYNNTMYAFKKHSMWKLFGSDSTNFEFVRISGIGCISAKTIKEVNGKLYFLGSKGIYSFDAGYPQLISRDLNETYTSGTAGGDNRRYYISLYNSATYSLYVYDTETKIWMREDASQITEFIYQYSAAVPNGYIIALNASDNKLYYYDIGSETVTMELTTKEWTNDTFNRKGTNRIHILADLETGTTMNILVKINNGAWSTVKSAYGTAELNHLVVPISVSRANHFQIGLVMVGEGKIYSLEREMYVGSKVGTSSSTPAVE